MATGRRDFLETLATGAIGAAVLGAIETGPAEAQAAARGWDLSWTKKLTGKYRAVFDVPVVEDGYGVWRAVIWRKQYATIFGVPETSLNTVVVLRHDGIALALGNQVFPQWQAAAVLTCKMHQPERGIAETVQYLLPRLGGKKSARSQKYLFPVGERQTLRDLAYRAALRGVNYDAGVFRVFRFPTNDVIRHEAHPGDVPPITDVAEPLRRQRPSALLAPGTPQPHRRFCQVVRRRMLTFRACDEIPRLAHRR